MEGILDTAEETSTTYILLLAPIDTGDYQHVHPQRLSIRSGTTHFNAMSPKDRVKFVGIMGYCTLAFSAPFAGAAEMSRRTRDDTTYAKMRPLSYRDCLANGSRLEDYAGLARRS
ncbi:hypothetical protein D6D22_07156 [Aureobasidium pullulans]|uniref:Uncharacterized protein n=1 Tax=Aureobasidium pullulans TaxID=5580 RepID=A0A4S8XCL9_AURPU|nr:hypothetical protein D6D22_07156 [Aureobasidium pullulans]THX22653.1 hypothetical protein D6D12_09015 [Aureobasidium pullulans]